MKTLFILTYIIIAAILADIFKPKNEESAQ